MPGQQSPKGPTSRRQRRQELRLEQAARPIGKRPRHLPAKRPAWQSPMVIVTALAVVAAILVIVVINIRPPATAPTALSSPANPVASAVARTGTTLGSSSAPVKMDVWEDYQCPYCQVWTEQWEPRVVRDFAATGILRYQFHDYAFIGTGNNPDESLAAAVAAQCANDQGQFWEYHDWLYANQNPNGENKGWFTTDMLDSITLKLGLDKTTFDTCLADPAKATAVKAEEAAGSALGISGTPSIFVNGTQVTLSTYDALAAQIRALAPALSSGSAGSPSPAASPSPSASPSPASPSGS
jgi:protein-disulfide isomerase